MKLIILFLSAIIVVLMSVLAYYSAAPWQAAGLSCFAALIPVILIYAYIPVWRRRAIMTMIIGFILLSIPLIWNDYNNGSLHFPITGIIGAGIGALIGGFAFRNRVKMRNSGMPYLPGDEHKSDEELASNADIKINIPWRKWNIFNRNS